MAVVVATSACPVKRTRHPPGFYRALHNRSTADVLVVDRDHGREHGKLSVRGSYILWRKMANIAFVHKGNILRHSCLCA